MMFPNIKKILYATDLSENARYAFGYAASIANRFGAGLTILHVMEDLSPDARSRVTDYLGEERWEDLKKKNEQRVLDTIKKRLEKFCEDATKEFPECPFITEDIIVKIGQPVEEILFQVENEDFDMVVMGSHGYGMLADVMMGGTTRRVLRQCKIPVLVVRLPERKE
jgi:nucleotide-binding universal stress UspA family protein